ncbi:alkaline shock response membrane anchor protein AmaP [Mitsuokella jalaludinii]|uniref:alkaline shock response membrane anchor protein AmaP n=1 Tax=Mitsuokella jalaludinii TaxID=187979 RepID=UPI000A5D05FB|nr:alkaline shock response membrane anchor protein AmaP [Mitsuokella jalaludinii]MCI7185478.1 alkaline shock response membrane anchor protein AmaP [Mitsuokella jalaludinii]
MGIINRFLLFVSMIGLALLSVLVLVLCMGVLPESVWLNEIHYILSRRETVAVSVVLLLVALHLLGVSLRGRAERTHERGDFILLQGAEGGVRVALPAIRAMAERTLLSLHGIRMAKVRVQRVRASKNAPETLRLVLDLTVSRGTPVASLTEAAAAAIRTELRETMGLEDVAVESHITAFSDAVPAGKRRVV